MARLKRTNTRAFKQLVEAHLLGSLVDYDGEDTPEAKARYIFERFDAEYNYPNNRRRFPNLQQRVAEWLAGLPLNIAYTNSDIIRLAEQWHEVELTDSQVETVLGQWFRFLALHLVRLWERHGIDPHTSLAA